MIHINWIGPEDFHAYSDTSSTQSREFIHCKVASTRLSWWLVALPKIFRKLIKEKFDAYVLWPLAKKFQNWIVDRSTAHDFAIH